MQGHIPDKQDQESDNDIIILKHGDTLERLNDSALATYLKVLRSVTSGSVVTSE